jgi:signal transduction histidine kinase
MSFLGWPRRGRTTTDGPARGGWPLYVIGVLALAVAAVAVPGAINWYGQPIAGVLVGPDAVVSGVMNADWDGARQGLDFPDRIVAIEGFRLDGLPQSERGRRLSQIVKRAASAGAAQVTVELRRGASERRIHLRIERLDSATWWLVAGSLFFAGVLCAVAGLVALWVSPRARLARTFAVVAYAAALFTFTFFDYHTSYRLVPLFLISFAMLPGALCMLALRLPDDAPWLRRFPWLERATTVAGIAVAAYFALPLILGRPMPRLHDLWSGVLGASFLFFVLAFLVRYLLAQGHRRDILRALTVAMAPPFAAVGLVLAAEPLVGRFSHADVLAYPALALAPIAVAFAFVRYDLWGSRALLSRILTRLVVGAVACTLAIAAGTALATAMGVPFRSAAIAATASGVVAAVLVVLALHAAEVFVFPSHAGFKPTIEQLSVDLIAITSPDEVGRAIERTVRRWLPCDRIRLVPTPAGATEAPGGTAVPALVSEPHTEEISAQGTAAGGSPDLVLPMVFGTERLGVLEVGAKPGGALFTSDDLDLLGTVVNQGALALAHARAYQELEQRRKQQAAAWRGEREALVETVAAEISHEIRYPLNFFRSLFGRAGGKPVAPEDLDIGREEVERLERLVGGLRRMAAHRIQRRSTAVRDLCGHAEMLLRDAAAGRPLAFAGEAGLAIRCDPDQATQILVNLLANALQATGDSGHAGVSWRYDGKDARIEVWDDGPGFVGDPAALFAPWYTTKERGTGLGLAITHRLVRSHGWTIEASRQSERTLFTVTVPKADVVQTEDRFARESRTEVS